MTTPQRRYDKNGKELPDSGHGCGCGLCQDSGAPRYERRVEPSARSGGTWSALHRVLFRWIRGLGPSGRAEAA